MSKKFQRTPEQQAKRDAKVATVKAAMAPRGVCIVEDVRGGERRPFYGNPESMDFSRFNLVV